jgi:hypothetical protein
MSEFLDLKSKLDNFRKNSQSEFCNILEVEIVNLFEKYSYLQSVEFDIEITCIRDRENNNYCYRANHRLDYFFNHLTKEQEEEIKENLGELGIDYENWVEEFAFDLEQKNYQLIQDFFTSDDIKNLEKEVEELVGSFQVFNYKNINWKFSR